MLRRRWHLNRGYYMAARRYEIFLRVLENISRVSAANEWNIFSTRENISLYYINTNEIPNHFTLIVFWCERRDLLWSHSNGDIFTCEDNMLFSHVKISSFRELTWYFIGVYIIFIINKRTDTHPKKTGEIWFVKYKAYTHYWENMRRRLRSS